MTRHRVVYIKDEQTENRKKKITAHEDSHCYIYIWMNKIANALILFTKTADGLFLSFESYWQKSWNSVRFVCVFKATLPMNRCNVLFKETYDLYIDSFIQWRSRAHRGAVSHQRRIMRLCHSTPVLISTLTTGVIQCKVLTRLPFCFSWIKKFLGQQSKIWVDNSVEKLFG